MRREPLTDALVQWVQDEGSKGTIPETRMEHHVVIGRLPAHLLAALNCADLELVTSVSALEKMMFDHGISAAKLKTIHQMICQTKSIFKSASHPGTSVVVMTMENLGSKPILFPIWLGKPGSTGKSPDHWVSSGYAKDNPHIFAEWKAAGLLLWGK